MSTKGKTFKRTVRPLNERLQIARAIEAHLRAQPGRGMVTVALRELGLDITPMDYMRYRKALRGAEARAETTSGRTPAPEPNVTEFPLALIPDRAPAKAKGNGVAKVSKVIQGEDSRKARELFAQHLEAMAYLLRL